MWCSVKVNIEIPVAGLWAMPVKTLPEKYGTERETKFLDTCH